MFPVPVGCSVCSTQHMSRTLQHPTTLILGPSATEMDSAPPATCSSCHESCTSIPSAVKQPLLALGLHLKACHQSRERSSHGPLLQVSHESLLLREAPGGAGAQQPATLPKQGQDAHPYRCWRCCHCAAAGTATRSHRLQRITQLTSWQGRPCCCTRGTSMQTPDRGAVICTRLCWGF
jgi:hypothetical protein